MKFTITIEVPEGTRVSVGDAEQDYVQKQVTAEMVPPFADELIPIPEAIPLPGETVAFRGSTTNVVPAALCPVHRVPWRQVPAGVSKKTGKPYDAFWACSERGCNQRPAA